MLQVNRNSWHAKLYGWWYRQKYGESTLKTDWTGEYPKLERVQNNPERSNLCPYMRAVLFWSWMRWLFLGGKVWKFPVPIASWLFLAIELPRWAGIVSYDLKQFLLIGESFLVGIAGMVAVFAAVQYLQSELGFFDTVIVPTRAAKEKTASFFQLIGEYLRSAHDRVCPEVNFRQDNQ